MKTKPQWIHEPGDGRPGRVYVDGVEIGRCVYADERRGFARFIPDPKQPMRHEVARGSVEFRPL